MQRFDNYKKALGNLSEAVSLSKERELSKLEKQGVIQSFGFTYELSWNLMKDFYISQGETEIQGSRDAFRMSFNRGFIEDGEVFMEIIKCRQLTSHSYNEETVEEIYTGILNKYYFAFKDLEERFEKEVRKNI